MRAVEFIRELLDLMDRYEKPDVNVTAVTVDTGVDRPFSMIKDLLKSKDQPVSDDDIQNRPNEAYSDIDSVTTNAGGGMNGSKHQDDLRGTTVNLYPRGN